MECTRGVASGFYHQRRRIGMEATTLSAVFFASTLILCIASSPRKMHAKGARKMSSRSTDKDIRGTVTSTKGAEAGVWVIAETTDLPTKFTKIVVTDDNGRYLLPDLPKANYKLWVRGYG